MALSISLNKLSKRYGSAMAVDQLSLEVEQGEVMGLLGPNGAGKSTTLAMIAGLVRPSAGSISIFGKDAAKHWVEVAPRIGVLVERPAFFENLSVRNNLQLHARLAGFETSLDRILDLTGLIGMKHVRARVLSQGMRQRLGLALALLTEPRLLLLDEPTSNLDSESAQEMTLWLRRISEEAGVTILFSTHRMVEVESLCDRVAVLHRGALMVVESARNVVAYDSRVVDVLIESGEGLARNLGELPFVESARAKLGRVQVVMDEHAVPQLASYLSGNGVQFQGIVPRRRTLQEYFLKAANQAGGTPPP